MNDGGGCLLDKLSIAEAKIQIDQLMMEIEKVIVGKRRVIQLAVTALLAEGHILFEDIPGVGKTMFAKTLGKSIQCQVNRVQFTPDLLPSDIVGVSIYDKRSRDFEFKPGSIFTDILLADEINRTTPRSQAALLEAMSEKQLTMDGRTYPLSPLFFVLATQNPADYEGTYPLPEAQLDRFLFRLSIGYPTHQQEVALVAGEDRQERLLQTTGILSIQEVVALRQLVKEIYVDPRLYEYAVSLVRQSRRHANVRVGVSPRGSLAFVQAAKAYALTEGRDYCVPDDFKRVLEPVFGHRLLLKHASNHDQSDRQQVLEEIQAAVAVPVGK